MNGQTPDPRLAKYRLGRLLGSGGMGEVRLAHDVALNRDVAIKFISADHVSDSDSRRRLVREAQAAAALDHPAICAVYEVNADSDHTGGWQPSARGDHFRDDRRRDRRAVGAHLIPVRRRSLAVRRHGAAAALAMGDKAQASALVGVASKTLGELTAAWKSDVETYLKRPDLVRLRRQAGMGSAH
jgi:Protein kinase domain